MLSAPASAAVPAAADDAADVGLVAAASELAYNVGLAVDAAAASELDDQRMMAEAAALVTESERHRGWLITFRPSSRDNKMLTQNTKMPGKTPNVEKTKVKIRYQNYYRLISHLIDK